MNVWRAGLGAVAAAALVLVAAGSDRAAPAPNVSVSTGTVLQLALEAPRVIDYEGTKVLTVLRGGRSQTVTAVEAHKRPDMMRLEYLSPQDVAGRLIVDNGRAAWHYEPSRNVAFEGPTMQAGLFSGGVEQLRHNYRITLLGLDEVVGRPAYVMLLEPRESGPNHELWVDQATGTVLRTEERDASGGVMMSTSFSRISFSLNLPVAYFEFQAPAGARVFPMFATSGAAATSDALPPRAGFDVLVPPVLPDGYVFDGGAVNRFGTLTSVYLRYSDGENLFSLFETSAASVTPGGGQTVAVGSATGRLLDLGYLRALTWEQGGVHLTAVGVVPSDTLIAIAAHLVADPEAASIDAVSQQTGVARATVIALRRQGLTFPEITRAAELSRAVGLDVPTTVRYLAGEVSGPQLAARLSMPGTVWTQRVQVALEHASQVGPHLAPSGP